MKRLILSSLALSLVLVALPVRAAPADAPAPACEGLDLLLTLSDLRSGPHLLVRHETDRVTVTDPRRGRTLLVATCDVLEVQGPDDFARPARRKPARTQVVRDGAGASVYTHSLTARGARVTVIAPGEVHAEGLHVVAFDNDDVHIRDGEGRLVFSRTTTPLGALIEREGPAYGCGCERSTAPDGRVEVRSL